MNMIFVDAPYPAGCDSGIVNSMLTLEMVYLNLIFLTAKKMTLVLLVVLRLAFPTPL